MGVLRERRHRVPENIAVVGFANWQIMTAGSRPPLTSVDMSLEQFGRVAAQALFAATAGTPGTPGTGIEIPLQGGDQPHHRPY